MFTTHIGQVQNRRHAIRTIGRIATLSAALAALAAAPPARADDEDDDGSSAPADPCASANSVRSTYADITIHDPVRSMKPEKAVEILAILHERGDIVMTPAPVRDPKRNCAVATPRPGDKVSIASTVAGVELKFVKTFDADNAVVSPRSAPLNNLNPRNAVGVYRLAVMLKERFQAAEIFHTGISGMDALSLARNPNNAKDMHFDGRAIDLTGIRTADGTEYNVLRDWGLASGSGRYRLAGNGTTEEQLFAAIYEFGAKYYNDNGSSRRSRIGEKSDVLHPDHPDAGFAAAHKNHVHLDISVVPKTY